jgi:hypothetical protein
MPQFSKPAKEDMVALTPHPPFFEIGDEVLYNHAGYRTKDEIGNHSPMGWREWRTYIVRRNEYLTATGKWMYQISEIRGDSVTIAAEEHLVDVTFPPNTRVELVEDWLKRKAIMEGKQFSIDHYAGNRPEAVWVVKSCRLVGNKSNSAKIVYDLQDECGSSLVDDKFGMGPEQLIPYGGPNPDVNGQFMVT